MNDKHRAWIFFLAMMFVALSLGPLLAHLLELPNKIDLSKERYFVVQNIYRGWAFLGFVVFGALISTLALTVVLRREYLVRTLALCAFLCVTGGQAVFWTWTYPANVATDNWTVAPENWQHLRTLWEFSHAADAVLNLAAMGLLIVAALAWRRNSCEPPSRSLSPSAANERK